MRYLTALMLIAIAASAATAKTPEERLASAGHTLPPPSKPIATYATAVRSGNLLFIAGHADDCGAPEVRGKLGREFTTEQGAAYAERVGLCILATMKSNLGELSRVKRFLRVMGMVNATPDFTEHPKVMNGFSNLMVVAFGEQGVAARSSMGLSSMPGDVPVEIEAIIELEQ